MNNFIFNSLKTITVFILLLLYSHHVEAVTSTFVVASEYYMSDDEIKGVASERAFRMAMSEAIAQANVYIESMTEVKNNVISNDVIRAVSAGVIKVNSKKLSSRITDNGDIVIRAELTVSIDEDSVSIYLPDVLKNWLIVEDNRRLQNEYSCIMKKMDKLKVQLAQAQSDYERQYIREQMNINDAEFTALQWYEKGDFFLIHNNEPILAIECFDKAIALNPSSVMSFCQRGLAKFESKNNDAAIKDYNRAIELDNQYFTAYYHRAWLHVYQHEYAEAISNYSKVIELRPKFYQAYTERALVYYAQKNYKAALEDCNKSLSLNSDDRFSQAMTYGLRSDIYKHLGDTNSASIDKKYADELYSYFKSQFNNTKTRLSI